MIQNIRLINPNMTRVNGYFYSFDEETDTMIQKTDDGTLAFAYPLDTPISQEVVDMEYDGESWWSMEHISGTPGDGFVIRRWVIENFVMVLQQSFTFATDSNDTFQSSAFTIEKYEGTIQSNGQENNNQLTVSYSDDVFDQITPGTNLFLGPSTKTSPTDFSGQTLRVTASTTNPATKTITLTSDKTVGFSAGDKVVFSKHIWVFNQNHLKQLDTGSLYKMNVLDGNLLSRTKGGVFKDINAAGFVDLIQANPPSGVFTGASLTQFNKPSYLIFVRTNNLLFIDVLDSQLTTELSAIQNNLSPDTTEVYEVFDLGLEGETIFRLQQKFNINGTETTESTYNYQLATFKPFPTAIALTADPAILPADSGNSNSTITATVTDQYALPFVQSPAATITFQTSGGGSGSGLTNSGPISLDSDGQATTTYITGDAAGLVTISAEVTI
ncbi:MAG: hypothetical protein GF334_03370 [Candidatus Altiarchaeales archaeon]|nr:hypothetical protein [Candidatus Altiarchaeales archaeon]